MASDILEERDACLTVIESHRAKIRALDQRIRELGYKQAGVRPGEIVMVRGTRHEVVRVDWGPFDKTLVIVRPEKTHGNGFAVSGWQRIEGAS